MLLQYGFGPFVYWPCDPFSSTVFLALVLQSWWLGLDCWASFVLSGFLVCDLFVLVLWARDDGFGILLVIPCSWYSSFGCLVLAIWPWFSGFGLSGFGLWFLALPELVLVSIRSLEFALLLLCLDLDSLALVDWLGHPVRVFFCSSIS